MAANVILTDIHKMTTVAEPRLPLLTDFGNASSAARGLPCTQAGVIGAERRKFGFRCHQDGLRVHGHEFLSGAVYMVAVEADPYPFELELSRAALLIIDMQRDFLESGGFGDALGNDVSLLRRAVTPAMALLAAARAAGMLVIHTREGHRPDLTDLPAAKRRRGGFRVGIGDAGQMGRILVHGEPGHDIIPELAPAPGEPVIDKPGRGKARFLQPTFTRSSSTAGSASCWFAASPRKCV